MAIPSRTEIRRVDHAVPLGVGLLALVQLVTAAAIALAPHWFFDNVGAFGAYNAHYVGDTAAFRDHPVPLHRGAHPRRHARER